MRLVILIYGVMAALGCSNASATSVQHYNLSLIQYEHSLEQCKKTQERRLQGRIPQGISKKEFEIALAYFHKNSLSNCMQREKTKIQRITRKLLNNTTIAKFIKRSAETLLESLTKQEKELETLKRTFDLLDSGKIRQLTNIDAYHRPFNLNKALGYYIN